MSGKQHGGGPGTGTGIGPWRCRFDTSKGKEERRRGCDKDSDDLMEM